jgi:hypothetical protein
MIRMDRLNIVLLPLGPLVAAVGIAGGIRFPVWGGLSGVAGLATVSRLTRRWRSTVLYRETIWALITVYFLFTLPTVLVCLPSAIGKYNRNAFSESAHEALVLFSVVFVTVALVYQVRRMRRSRRLYGFGGSGTAPDQGEAVRAVPGPSEGRPDGGDASAPVTGPD